TSGLSATTALSVGAELRVGVGLGVAGVGARARGGAVARVRRTWRSVPAAPTRSSPATRTGGWGTPGGVHGAGTMSTGGSPGSETGSVHRPVTRSQCPHWLRAGASPLTAADVTPASTAVIVTVTLWYWSTAPTYTWPVTLQPMAHELFTAPETVIRHVPP